MNWVFLGSEVITSSGGASTYSLTLPSSLGVVNMIELAPINGQALVTWDGSAPSSVAAIQLSTGRGPYQYSHNAMHAAKIVFSSSDAALYASYFQ